VEKAPPPGEQRSKAPLALLILAFVVLLGAAVFAAFIMGKASAPLPESGPGNNPNWAQGQDIEPGNQGPSPFAANPAPPTSGENLPNEFEATNPPAPPPGPQRPSLGDVLRMPTEFELWVTLAGIGKFHVVCKGPLLRVDSPGGEGATLYDERTSKTWALDHQGKSFSDVSGLMGLAGLMGAGVTPKSLAETYEALPDKRVSEEVYNGRPVWVFEAGKGSTYLAITVDKATGLPLASSQSGKWLDATATYDWVRTSGIEDSEVSVPAHYRQEESLL